MKGLLLVASLVLSASAFAVDANSTWSDINASYKTDVKAPQVGFAAGEATTFISIFDTCVDGDTIKTLEAKDVYAQVRHGKNDVELVVVGQEVLSHPMTFVVNMPTGNKNGETKAVTVTIPVNNEIEVYSARTSNHNAEQTLLFTKSFSIPACK